LNFRNNTDKILRVAIYYFIGPILTTIFIYNLIEGPSSLLGVTQTRGRFESGLIWGALGIILTFIGIVRLLSKGKT
jgi:FtsH-binding integral membrane protein